VYKECLDLTLLMHGPEHIDVARTLQNVAIALTAVGRLPEAEQVSDFTLCRRICDSPCDNFFSLVMTRQHYKRAVSVLLKILGDRHPETATVQMNLAVLYGRMKRTSDALKLAELAVGVHKVR